MFPSSPPEDALTTQEQQMTSEPRPHKQRRPPNRKRYPNWFRRLQKKLPYPAYQYATPEVLTVLFEQHVKPDEAAAKIKVARGNKRLK